MRPLEPGEVARKLGASVGDKWWTVVHSPSYKVVELQFLETVQMGGARIIHPSFMVHRELRWDFLLDRLSRVHQYTESAPVACGQLAADVRSCPTTRRYAHPSLPDILSSLLAHF